jgi:bacterioferritin-associated ferredoxin
LKWDFNFSYDSFVATQATFPTPCPRLPQEHLARREARRMRRCECAGVAFAEVAREVHSGLTLEQACDRTGCGRMCSACLPDLQHALADALRRS